MPTDEQRFRDAAARYGPAVDHIAKRYTNPRTGQRLSGEALVLKLLKGESGFRMNAVSPAGARAGAQFMPSSRKIAIQRFKVDPWRSPEEAVRGATLHLRGKINGSAGLEGYNPGDPNYPAYILGQEIGETRGRAPARGGFGQTGAQRGGGGGVTSSEGGGQRESAFGGDGVLGSKLRALAAQVAQPAPAGVASSPVPVPEFSARAVLPENFMQVPSVQQAPAREGSGLAAQLEALARGADAPTFGTPDREGDVAAEGGGLTGGGGARGGGRLRPGGGYKGTQGLAGGLAGIAHDLGLKTSNTKRNNTNPYSGKGSDHDYGNKDAFAHDIGTPGVSAPDEKKDRAAFRIMQELGFKDYRMGQPIDTSRGVKTIKTKEGTFRVQVIYRGSGEAFGGNHLDHIHVGVKRVG